LRTSELHIFCQKDVDAKEIVDVTTKIAIARNGCCAMVLLNINKLNK